jgi:predicted HicB family RNase H-like nuclease
MNIMKYKSYIAQIEYSDEDEEFFGTVINLSRDSIVFGGKTVAQLKKHMHEAIDGHIENCRKLNIEPEKPYSGRITFRTSPEEHAILVEAALSTGNKSLNEWMNKVLLKEVERVKYSSDLRNNA